MLDIKFQQYLIRFEMMTLLSPNVRWGMHCFQISDFLKIYFN